MYLVNLLPSTDHRILLAKSIKSSGSLAPVHSGHRTWLFLQEGFKENIDYTESCACHLVRKNHRVIWQRSAPLGGILSPLVAFKAAIKAI